MTSKQIIKPALYIALLSALFSIFKYIWPENKAYGIVAIFFFGITVALKLKINLLTSLAMFIIVVGLLYLDISTKTFFYVSPKAGEHIIFILINAVIIIIPLVIAQLITKLEYLFYNHRINSDGK